MNWMGLWMMGVLVFEDAKLVAPMPVDGGRFGSSVDRGVDLATIGARGENGGDVGRAWLVRAPGGDWLNPMYAELVQPDPKSSDRYGDQVALGDTCVVVSATPDGKPMDEKGIVYVFDVVNGNYKTDQYYMAKTPLGSWGEALAVSSDCTTIIVGAPDTAVEDTTGAGVVEILEFDPVSMKWLSAAVIPEPDEDRAGDVEAVWQSRERHAAGVGAQQHGDLGGPRGAAVGVEHVLSDRAVAPGRVLGRRGRGLRARIRRVDGAVEHEHLDQTVGLGRHRVAGLHRREPLEPHRHADLAAHAAVKPGP